MRVDKKYIVVAIILMAIGFAAVSTTLILNGTIQIGFNSEDFSKNVIFTRSETDTEGTSEIIEEGKKITFTSKILSKVGDTAELDFDITNRNTEYDANVVISCVLVSEAHQEYLNIETGKLQYELAALETTTDKLSVTLKKAYLGNDIVDAEFACTMDVKPISRSKKAITTTTTTTTKPVEYKENLISGAEPKVSSGLIPVTITSNGIVTYADINQKWYSYANKEWANAVILKSNPSKTYKVGNTILESDIDAYFVWIPKFRYKLWNVNVTNPSKNAHTIEVEFNTANTTNTSTSCATPMTSGGSGTCANGMYMTHPAFISMNVNGFWVGKFETGYRGATSKAGAEVNNSNSLNIIVKPNVYSWRGNTIYNYFVSHYNYNRSLNSHMMKNTEWGAVTYLSHSQYGIGTEIRINNNSDYLTGYSSVTAPTCYYGDYTSRACNLMGITTNETILYNTSLGYKASTTGNITGIYDMSGGAHEYTSSYQNNAMGSSGFTSSTIANYNSKYFDIYNASSSIYAYQYRILGDATGEMGPFEIINVADIHGIWYGDYSAFLSSTGPWFGRGGAYYNGTIAGTFCFSGDTGEILDRVGTRLILSP